MRIVFFTHPGTNSRDIFLDMARGFERGGHDVLRLEIEPIANVYKAAGASRVPVIRQMTGMIAKFMDVNRVDFSVGMWANALGVLSQGVRNGQPRSFFDVIERPHLMFWLDAPHWASGGSLAELCRSPLLSGRYVRHYVNNPGISREMTEVLGFGPTIGRGYGIDEDVFRPHRDEEERFDIVFGTGPGDAKPSALMLRELESDEPDVQAMREERAVGSLSKLRELAQTLDAADAMMELFEGLVRLRLARPGTPMLEDLERLEREGMGEAGRKLRELPSVFVRAFSLVRGIESWRRAFTITYLSKRLKCAVFGQAEFGEWPCEARLLGNLAYGDMAWAYSSGRIGLNAMRWQDDVGLNLKPYEITASGAALLCDRRVGLDEAFEDGVEVESFAGPAEALAKARGLLGDTARRRAMAEAGRERTLRDHTWAQVSRELVAWTMRDVSEQALCAA